MQKRGEPKSIDDVLLWLRDIGMEKYTPEFARNEIDGEMLKELGERELAEVRMLTYADVC